MKIFLLFLCIVSLGLFQSASDFESVDIAQAQSDPQIQSLIDAGLQTIIEDGLKTDQVQSSNFKLSKINRIMKQEADGDNYKFDCSFVNDQGFTIRANFGVNYKAATDETLVTDFTYTIEKESLIEDVETKYSRVLYDDYDRFPQLQELVAYGTDEMIKSCIENGNLANSSYSVVSVNRIDKQNYGDALFYKCNVDMQSEDTELNANFTVYYRPQRDVQILVDYSCEINSQENGSNDVYMNTATIKPLEDKYTPQHEEDVQDNLVATEALNYGTEEINEYAFEEGEIQTELEVLKIESVDSQIAGNGAYYRFSCLLQNNHSETVVADFTVFYDAYSANKSLVSYWYAKEKDNREGEIVIPANIEFVYPEPDKEDEIYGEKSPVKPGISIFDVVFPLSPAQVEDEAEVEDILMVEEPVVHEEDNEAEAHDVPVVVLVEEEPIVEEEEKVVTEVIVLTVEEYEQLVVEAEDVKIVVIEEQVVINEEENVYIQVVSEEDDEQIIYETELEEHDVPIVVVVEEQIIPVEEEYELIIYEAEVEEEEEEEKEPVKTVFVIIKNEEKDEEPHQEVPEVKPVVVVQNEPKEEEAEPVKVVEAEEEHAEDIEKEKQEEEVRKEEEKRKEEEAKEREDRAKEQEKLREEQEKEREKEAKEREKEREDREKELEKLREEQEKEREKEREDRDKRGKD